MGIYIKGMKLDGRPHKALFTERDGKFVLVVETQYSFSDKEIKVYPVEELPPHGDLIGREWLIDIALHLINTAKNDDIANGVKWLWRYIIEAPTIIPAEEVRDEKSR